jgi:hypothetical protein
LEETIFSLRYEGEGISEGLEPSAFADATRGFAEFIISVTEVIHGDQIATTLKVHRLSQGSLVLEILQRVGSLTVSDMLAIGASVSNEIKLAVELLKHLRGQPPKAVTPEAAGSVVVTNNYGDIAVFNNSTVNVVLNNDVGGSIARFVRPIASGQAKSVAVAVDRRPVATVEKEDVPFMVSVSNEKMLLENETETWLTVTKAVLEGSANWSFTDGRRPFTAPVNDTEFLKSVQEGRLRFGNGDRLLVRLKSTQSQRGERLRAQYEITSVLRHEARRGGGQMKIAGI